MDGPWWKPRLRGTDYCAVSDIQDNNGHTELRTIDLYRELIEHQGTREDVLRGGDVFEKDNVDAILCGSFVGLFCVHCRSVIRS